jgi:ATP-dependent Clp protease protease subunit
VFFPNRKLSSAEEIGPAPDLPSLFFQNRIIYIGTPIVPAVTENIVQQLLLLSHTSPDAEITLQINSPGSRAPNFDDYTFETETLAIVDTLLFIPCPIRTICVGKAYGTAALLLALGEPGKRFALPNAFINLQQARSVVKGTVPDIAIKAKELAVVRDSLNSLFVSVSEILFSGV